MQLAKSQVYQELNFIGKLKRDFRINKLVYLMTIPVLAYFIIFHYIPMLGLVITVQDFSPAKGFFGSKFVGLKHFTNFLTSFYALRVIGNTLIINSYEIIFGFPAPIILALLLNEIRSKIYKRVIQTISYMPHFISIVVICGLILDFTKSGGIVNDIAVFFGKERVSFMTLKDSFRFIFVSSSIWQHIGWGSIIYIATLSAIDPSLYEACVIDGGGRFKQLLYITLPSLVPTIIVLFIMRLGHIMSIGFEKIILLYNPLTYETADVISSYVYRSGLQEANYSFGSAVGLFNAVINCIVLVTANYLSRRFAKESLW